jgi:hypothetical protein
MELHVQERTLPFTFHLWVWYHCSVPKNRALVPQ